METSTELGANQLAVLWLLTIGDTTGAIARKLHLSPRTVGSYTARIMAVLAAPTRFIGGVHTIRHRHVDPQWVLDHASRRCLGPDWLVPTPRQRDILLTVATGASDELAAEALGLSVRTLQRDLSALAAANGVRGAFATAALAETLGWTAHSSRQPR